MDTTPGRRFWSEPHWLDSHWAEIRMPSGVVELIMSVPFLFARVHICEFCDLCPSLCLLSWVAGQNGFHNCPRNDDLTPGRYLSTPPLQASTHHLGFHLPGLLKTHSVDSTPKPSATASGYRLPPENKEPIASHPAPSCIPTGRLLHA